MTLQQLNESSWIGKVGKTFKEKGTVGAFTNQCKEMGFRGPSMACVKYVFSEYKKKKIEYISGKISKEEYDKWLQMNRRASFTKTSKKLGKDRRKRNEME